PVHRFLERRAGGWQEIARAPGSAGESRRRPIRRHQKCEISEACIIEGAGRGSDKPAKHAADLDEVIASLKIKTTKVIACRRVCEADAPIGRQFGLQSSPASKTAGTYGLCAPKSPTDENTRRANKRGDASRCTSRHSITGRTLHFPGAGPLRRQRSSHNASRRDRRRLRGECAEVLAQDVDIEWRELAQQRR